jgi:LCP family protein required for cell wall assembly
MASTLSTRRGWRIAATVASCAVLATSGVGYAAVNRYAGQVGLVDAGILGGSLAEGEPVTMLVVASDDRTGLSAKERSRLRLGQDDYGQHTDTMLLVHLSADGQDISAVSLPRDTLATIPAWTDDDGTERRSREAKLNAAYSLGGPKLMVDTVESMTGVTIDHYAEINFAGFLTMVDALDGVEVCLAKATKDSKSGLDLPAGRQTVDGKQALAYVRARYFDPTADIGRMERQQKFVGAMAKKALSADTLTNPVKLDAFLSAVAQSIKTDSGMGTDQMLDLVERFKGINPSRIAFVTVPLGDDFRHPDLGSVLTWDEKEAAALFTAMEQDRPLVEPSPTASAAPTVTVAPREIRVRVLNGTDVAGLGAKAAGDLATVGFAVVGDPANASAKVGEKTVVRYDDRYTESVKTVAAALPGAELVAVKGLGSTFEITVGTGYTGAQKVKVVAASPSASSSSKPQPRTAADDICG